jgi:DNA-binding transcriptional regulator YdaS (Cro superfamily)
VVIDELILVLGLDSRKFNEGQRQAMDSFKKGKEGAIDFGNRVEESAAKMSEAFSVVRKGALGLVGAFVGGEAASFINHVITMDAATGRMAKTIGTSVQNLSAWQYMIRQVGGEATSATSALSSLQQEIENVRQGGGMFEGGFASLMNQAGVSIRDDADTSLRKIQGFIAGQISSGKMRPEEAATFLRRVPGMNQDMLNLMLADFQKIEAAAHAAGTATDETAKAAAALQGKFTLMIQSMERFGASMIPLIELLMKPTGQITKDDLGKAIGGNDLFTRGGFMDWLDQQIWGDHNMADAKRRLTEGLRGAGAGGGPGGTTRGDRNNNPGNMEYGAFARAHGATGSDGRFAIFPDWASGAAAQQALISGSGYAGLTLHQFASKYAEGAPAWEHTVGGALGIGPNDIVNNQDPRLADAIRRAEGTGARGAAGSRVNSSRTSTSTSETNINKIEIHAPNATDAEGIAGELGGALKRQSMIAPINNALV